MKRLLLSTAFSFLSFLLYGQELFDVVIDEIMADPSPVVGLPNAEYIELKNRSTKAVNLQGWKLISGSSSATFPSYTLQPDSFLIISSTTNAVQFAVFGKALGIPSFPSLVNEGATLTLVSKENKTIHFVSYTSAWYDNPVKEDGGWSLEMIDTRNPCSGKSNWKVSTDLSGGTPGRKNSVDGINKDEAAPALKNIYAKDAITLVLQFDEPLDSASAVTANVYQLNPSVGISKLSLSPTSFSELTIVLSSPLDASQTYQFSCSPVKDCAGNSSGKQTRMIGMPQSAGKEDLVINEVLFNPKTGGNDFVEMYNRSKKIIDLNKIYLANKSGGTVANAKKITETPFYLFPGEYVAITTNVNSLMQQCFIKNTEYILSLSSLHSYPDDKGIVVLLNEQGLIVDEVAYEDDWHFGLLADKEGVSLERIDPDKPAQNKNNWHSAASTAGYATPGYRNSQYKQVNELDATIEVTPKTFSPDNDGRDDVAIIQYAVEESGYMANLRIMDAKGREVRYLVKNELLGIKGKWLWDGLDENKRQLPIGPYIIYSELFNLKGKKKSFKTVVVLARAIR